jgi:hypothetical protein
VTKSFPHGKIEAASTPGWTWVPTDLGEAVDPLLRWGYPSFPFEESFPAWSGIGRVPFPGYCQASRQELLGILTQPGWLCSALSQLTSEIIWDNVISLSNNNCTFIRYLSSIYLPVPKIKLQVRFLKILRLESKIIEIYQYKLYNGMLAVITAKSSHNGYFTVYLDFSFCPEKW